MKPIVLTVALLSTSLAAQTTTSPSPIVAVGCVGRAVQTGSLAGGPGVPPATPETAPALANSQELTGGFVLQGAKSVAPSGDRGAKPITYALDGKTAELEQHVGHQVEVTGTLRTTEAGMPGAKTQLQQLQVVSFKMRGQCPKS